MARMHLKGFVLQQIARNRSLRDDEIVRAVRDEYGVSGAYWTGTVRLTLIDLYGAGLLDEVDAEIDPDGDGTRLRFRYRVTDFGRERMAQSGLEVTT